MKVHIDIETRSRADLPEVGAYRYGCDESTQVLMAAVSEEDAYSPVYLWVNPLFRDAGVESEPEAMELLAQADEVRAFNAPFEQPVLHGTMFEPRTPLQNWRCTQAMARIAGLPDSLEKCGDALGITAKKDARGKALIRLFSISNEDGTFNEPRDHREKWAEFCEYCRQDVRAEKEIHRMLRHKFDLKGEYLDTFQFTMRMNHVGIPINAKALDNAQTIIDDVQSEAGVRFREITGLNITQRAKILEWLRAKKVNIADMRADTLARVTLDGLEPEVAEVIQYYMQMSYAAVKKVTAMRNWAMPDGRMRGVFKYYGAGTGRWSAGGPQIQNAKKATPAMRPKTKLAYAAICAGADAEEIKKVYGEPMEVIASCIRHFVHAQYADIIDARFGETQSEARIEMLDADYNAIEARLICWLSKETEMLEAWAEGTDLYRKMASQIYDTTIDRVSPDQRDMGKRTILGCGYGMGADKFLMTCRTFGVKCDEKLAQKAVNAYRNSHKNVVAYWRRLNFNALEAVRRPNVAKNEFICQSAAGKMYLFCRLASGRTLAYRDAQIEHEPKYGEYLSYWGQLSGSQQWGRIKLYGGKLAENICQATAADLMSHGARTAESRGMMPFALIHDQGLCVSNGKTPEEFAAALTALPSWARDLPLKVEAKFAPFYSK